MAAKPAAVIQIALYANGRVQCGMEGQVNKPFVAQGLALATQSLLDKIDAMAREPSIEVPPESAQKQLLAAR
jgi:hypothetical protein